MTNDQTLPTCISWPPTKSRFIYADGYHL